MQVVCTQKPWFSSTKVNNLPPSVCVDYCPAALGFTRGRHIPLKTSVLRRHHNTAWPVLTVVVMTDWSSAVSEDDPVVLSLSQWEKETSLDQPFLFCCTFLVRRSAELFICPSACTSKCPQPDVLT